MKHLFTRVIAWALLLSMLLGLAPMLPLESLALGINPTTIGRAEAGQTMRIDIFGDNMYSTTNLIFKTDGNTIAEIDGYDDEGEQVCDLFVCSDNWSDWFANAQNDYYFEIKVLYGAIYVTANSANTSYDPTVTYQSHGDALDWLVKPNMSVIRMTVGDQVTLDVGEVVDGYSARIADVELAEYPESANEDGDTIVWAYTPSCVLEAQAPGSTVVTARYLFWVSSEQYFYVDVPVYVTVLPDYTLARYDDYYSDPGKRYFNIVGYDAAGSRVRNFTITAGSDTYSTDDRYDALIDLPGDFSGEVTITKDGYLPYTIPANRLQMENVVIMTPVNSEDPSAPAIQAVWVSNGTEETYVNSLLQVQRVTADSNALFTLSYDIAWNGHSCAAVYLKQGNVTLPLAEGDNTIPLGQYFTGTGGEVTINALTADGYTLTAPLMLTVASPITQLDMDFGDSFSGNIQNGINGIGGAEIAFDLTSTIPVKIIPHHDGTVRGIIGVKFSTGTSEKDLLDLYDEIRETVGKIKSADAAGDHDTGNTYMRQLNQLLEDRDAILSGKRSTFGFSAGVDYLGYFDATLDGDQLSITQVGIISAISVSGTASQTVYATTPPYQWTLQFTDKLEMMYSSLRDPGSGELSLNVPQFSNTFSVSGKLASGILGSAEAVATLTGSLKATIPAEGDFSDGVWVANLNFHAGVNLLGLELKELLDWSPIEDVQVWPHTNAAALSTQDTSPKVTLTASPISRDYLTAGSEYVANQTADDQPENTGGIAQAQTLKTNTYPDTTPQLVHLDGMDLLVWTDDNAQRTDGNRTCLYYSVYDHTSGTWSEPAPVSDDGCADFYPQLFVLDGTAYLAWMKANTLLPDSPSLEETALAMDIYVASFNASTCVFNTPEPIHDPDTTLDQFPQLAMVDGTLTAVWIRSETPLDPQGESQLIRATYSQEDGWMSRSAAALSGTPTGLALNTDGAIYYTLNGILYGLSNGVTTAITDGSTCAASPVRSGNTVYYLADGILYMITRSGERYYSSKEATLDASASGFRILTDEGGEPTAIVYYSSASGSYQLTALFSGTTNYDSIVWSQPMTLTQGENTVRGGLSGYCDAGGELRVAVNSVTSDPATMDSTADLQLLTVPHISDLELTDVSYIGTSLAQGSTLAATACITNNGTTTVKNLTVAVYQGDTQIAIKSVPTFSDYTNHYLLPGESINVELALVTEELTGTELRFEVQPGTVSDAAPEDNTAVLLLTLEDISIENITAQLLPDGTVDVAAMLINRGRTDLDGIQVVFTKGTSDGEVLATVDVGSAALGQTQVVSANLSGLTEGDLVYMTAVTGGEENYLSNNTAFTQVNPMPAVACRVSRTEPISETMETDILYTGTLEAGTGDDETSASYITTFTPDEDGFYRITLTAFAGTSGYSAAFVEGIVSGPSVYCPIYSQFTETELEVSTEVCSLKQGTTYTLEFTGVPGLVYQVKLERVDSATTLHIDDFTLYEGDSTYIDELEHITSDSYVDLTYVSTDPSIAEVDEYGTIQANSPGTATVTATCSYSGISTTFTVTVLARETAGTLTEGQSQYVEWDYYTFTPERTGYYHISFIADIWIRTEVPGEHLQWIYCESGNDSFLLQKGVTYMLRTGYFGDLLIDWIGPEEMLLEDYFNCGCPDCPGVMLYRHVPEQDTPVNLYHYSKGDHDLIVYDENYQVITSFHSGYGGAEEQYVLKQGQTYYFALEHIRESRLALYEIYGYLCLEDSRDEVFVGDTISFYMYYTSDLYAPKLELTLTSSDPSVAKVNADGTVTFLKAGIVTITGKALEGSLVSSMTLDVLPSYRLTLNVPKMVTLDGIEISGTKVSFTPAETDTYVFTLRYQTTEGYWEYYFDMTESSGGDIECLNNENLSDGNTLTLVLEAGKTYDLRLYYSAYMGRHLLDMTFLVTKADCERNGHNVVDDEGYEPGCDYPGMTDGQHCSVCRAVILAQKEIPALGHSFSGGICTRCGTGAAEDPNVARLYGDNRWATSLRVADEMKTNLGVDKFDNIVIASGMNFADALSGSYLAAVKDAPILLCWCGDAKYDYLNDAILEYVSANLAQGGKVYILGGTAAVPQSLEDGLTGCDVERLAGANRFETNLLILKEAGVAPGQEILVCTGTNFADSLSASATALPILMVWNESGKLTDSQAAYLKTLSGNTFCVIGGENAVGAKLESAVSAYGEVTRLAGKNRFETSVLVAETYFSEPDAAVLAYAWNYPDGLCGGVLAYSMGCPLILTMTKYESAASAYIRGEDIESGVVLGGTGLISDDSVRTIFAMEADDAIFVK